MKDYSDYYPSQNSHIIQGGNLIFDRQLLGLEGKDILINDSDVSIRALVQRHTDPLHKDVYDYVVSVKNDYILNNGDIIYHEDEFYIVLSKPRKNDIYNYADMQFCNNTLRRYNSDGKLIEIPCIMYKNNENSSEIKDNKYFQTIKGDTGFIVQKNSEMAKIKPGERLIFSGTVFKVGQIIGYFQSGLIYIGAEIDENSEYDNSELNIANYYNRPTFTLDILEGDVDMTISSTTQLSASVINSKGESVEKDIMWYSDDELIATVDSDGLVTTILEGVVHISASMLNNEDVTNSITVNVVSIIEDNYEVAITPDTDIIRLTNEVTFNCKLLNNGVDTTDEFTFSIHNSTTASDSDYIFAIIDGNNFKLENENDGKEVVIECISGSHTLYKTIKLEWLY